MGELSTEAAALTALIRTDPDAARARIAELFAVHGGCLATATAIGVSRNSLYVWMTRLEMEPPVRARKGAKRRRPDDSVIRDAFARLGTVTLVAAELGISREAVRLWRRSQPTG